MMVQNGGPVIRGRHVLFMMLGLFGIVISVNTVFVYLALDTFTGVSRENPYQEGLTYNQVLQARDAQRHLGWQGAVELIATADGHRLTVTVKDQAGTPLDDLKLNGRLRRPTHQGMDQALTWRAEPGGRYVADVALPARGNWDLEVTADDGSNPPFEMKARLWLK